MTEQFQPDLHSYEFENNPLPTLEKLRREDPVHWSRHGYWLITRYEDVKTVLGDPRRFSSAGAGFGANNPLAKGATAPDRGKIIAKMSEALAKSFNQQDPPAHTRIRKLVQNAFSRKEITERDDRIRQTAEALYAEAVKKGEFDLVTDFAFHLPIIVAAEVIGIPTDEREQFRRAFEASARLMAPVQSEAEWNAGLESAIWQGRYMAALIKERQETPREDLISALIEAVDGGDRLTPEEISPTISTIFTAAGTTTERLISSGVFLLLTHPEELEKLRADPTLLDSALEEILRYHHPTQSTSTNRRATKDVELGGKQIKAGDTVRVSLGSANRDERAFEDPDRFRIDRNGPNHLSFGHGIHFCIGSVLARYEAKIAFEILLLGPDRLELVTLNPLKDPDRPDRFKDLRVRFVQSA